MRLLDEQYTQTPFYGIRRMTAWLQTQGQQVNHKRVARLLRLLGLEAIYQKPRLSQHGAGYQIYPYLLRGLKVERSNQVWSTDITYIRLHGGFVYLTAVIDWYLRYVLSWEVSLTLDTDFCTSALQQALQQATPEIFNTDQGVQFTSNAFTGILKERKIAISMDGRGRALDNIFVERLWRSVKYEEVYLHDYEGVPQAITGLDNSRRDGPIGPSAFVSFGVKARFENAPGVWPSVSACKPAPAFKSQPAQKCPFAP